MPLSASSRVPLRYIRPVHPKLTKQKQTKTQYFGQIKKSATFMKHFFNLSCFLQLVLFSSICPVFCNLSCFLQLVLFSSTCPVLFNLSCFLQLVLFSSTCPVFCNLSCFLQLYRVSRTALFWVITQRIVIISYRVPSPVGKTKSFLVC